MLLVLPGIFLVWFFNTNLSNHSTLTLLLSKERPQARLALRAPRRRRTNGRRFAGKDRRRNPRRTNVLKNPDRTILQIESGWPFLVRKQRKIGFHVRTTKRDQEIQHLQTVVWQRTQNRDDATERIRENITQVSLICGNKRSVSLIFSSRPSFFQQPSSSLLHLTFCQPPAVARTNCHRFFIMGSVCD